jgi:hypothetical protein
MTQTRLPLISRRVENLTRARAFRRDTLPVPELNAFPGLGVFRDDEGRDRDPHSIPRP